MIKPSWNLMYCTCLCEVVGLTAWVTLAVSPSGINKVYSRETEREWARERPTGL